MQDTKRAVLQAVHQHPGVMSATVLDHLLRGQHFPRMAERELTTSPHFGALKTMPSVDVLAAINACLTAGLVAKARTFYASLSLTPAGENVVRDARAGTGMLVSPAESYESYRTWRRELARRYNKPPYRLLTNQLLNELARRAPATLDELLMVPGLGKQRALRYQADLLPLGAAIRQTAPHALPAPAAGAV